MVVIVTETARADVSGSSFSQVLKNDPVGSEDGIGAEVRRGLEVAVEELGRAELIHHVTLVEVLRGLEHEDAAVGEVERGVHGHEGQLALPVVPDANEGGVYQIEVVAIPHVGPDDAPPADHLARARHT
jgi:hypothetical protein